MKKCLNISSIVLLCLPAAFAQVARHVDTSRVAVENRSYSGNADVNRSATVNSNVNVNRNVNVQGASYGGNGYRGPVVVQDDSWNWGSFAAGAPAGAVTGAVVGAATSSHAASTAAPAVGTVVTALPGACTPMAAGGTVVYNCNNVHYQPFYQGITLVYQVVK